MVKSISEKFYYRKCHLKDHSRATGETTNHK